VLDAVLMAVRRRRPCGTMIHSNHVTQYGTMLGAACARRIANFLSILAFAMHRSTAMTNQSLGQTQIAL